MEQGLGSARTNPELQHAPARRALSAIKQARDLRRPAATAAGTC